jgi:NAD(P)-dependent dehydrogenase (short-subunit alcohol dehydrogenase family)
MTGTALVTGGTGGLGGAVTAALLGAGWRVVLPVRGTPPAATGDLVPVHADLLQQGDVTQTVAAATADPRRPLGAVVNLVGGFASGGRVHETPIEEFEAQLTLNLRPLYLVSQAALPALVAAGGGTLVCVSSQSTARPFAGAAGYLTAKTGVLAFAGVLHAEYARDGVRVNTILPGVIDTPANRASQPKADWSKWTPPESIARTVVFL